MNALLEQFLLEGRDLIQQATRDLIALERTPSHDTLLTEVFRAFHTLKGSSGVFDVRPMTRVLHAAEEVLENARAGTAAIDGGLTDALLETLDQTARWLDALEMGDGLDDGADAVATGLVQRLRGVEAKGADVGTRDEDDPDAFTEAERRKGFEALKGLPAGAGLFRITYLPDRNCFFAGEDPLKLVRRLDGLVALRIQPREAWPAAEALDPFVCALRIDALAVGEESVVRQPFRLVTDQVRIGAVEAESLAPPEAADIVGSVLDEQRRLLADGGVAAGEVAGRWGSAAAAAANALRHEG
ncbi:hypothetical protein N825_25540, partial [Skermanella stibiiresistens SB22]